MDNDIHISGYSYQKEYSNSKEISEAICGMQARSQKRNLNVVTGSTSSAGQNQFNSFKDQNLYREGSLTL